MVVLHHGAEVVGEEGCGDEVGTLINHLPHLPDLLTDILLLQSHLLGQLPHTVEGTG